MNINSVVVLLLLSCVALTAADVWAAGPVDVSAEVGVQSKYVWRGYLLTDGPVLQPSVTVGLKGLSLNLWGNMDLEENDIYETKDSFEMNEIDYTLSYNRSFFVVDASVGVIHYTFPNIAYEGATTEIFVSVSGSVPGNPSITIYHDLDEAEGTYASISASQSIPVGLLLGIEVSGALGLGSKKLNEFYSGMKAVEEAGGVPKEIKDTFIPTDILIGIGVPIGIGDFVNITPCITYTGIINSDISDNLELQSDNNIVLKKILDNNVYFGITASVSF